MVDKIIDSLYLHFPFCRHLCNYCDFYKLVPTNREVDLSKFHAYLEQSYQIHEKMMNEKGYHWAPLKTLYLGGGTPSLWGKEGALFLQEFLQEKGISLSPECEFTLEVNPGTWTKESLEEWRKIGANRFSLGVQSYHQEMLKVLDRVHSLEDVKEILAFFHEWDVNFSVDFMLGLPRSGDLKRDVLAELKEVLKYEPDHLSLYILTVKSNYKHYQFLPNEEWVEKEYLEVSENLMKQGYLHYEVSNFAKKDKQSKHNLSYWKSNTVAALGPSATGFLKEDRFRYKWKTVRPEIEEEVLTEEEFQMEQGYMSLRSEEGLFIDPQLQSGDFIKLIEQWIKNDWATFENNTIFLKSKGFLLLDSRMNDLFRLKLI